MSDQYTEIKIEKKYVSTGEIEKNLKKYYWESDASKKVIEEVVQDMQDQMNDLLTLQTMDILMGNSTKLAKR